MPDLLISNIFAGTMEQPTKGSGQNWLPVFSPDGRYVAYVVQRGTSGFWRDSASSGLESIHRCSCMVVIPSWVTGTGPAVVVVAEILGRERRPALAAGGDG